MGGYCCVTSNDPNSFRAKEIEDISNLPSIRLSSKSPIVSSHEKSSKKENAEINKKFKKNENKENKDNNEHNINNEPNKNELNNMNNQVNNNNEIISNNNNINELNDINNEINNNNELNYINNELNDDNNNNEINYINNNPELLINNKNDNLYENENNNNDNVYDIYIENSSVSREISDFISNRSSNKEDSNNNSKISNISNSNKKGEGNGYYNLPRNNDNSDNSKLSINFNIPKSKRNRDFDKNDKNHILINLKTYKDELIVKRRKKGKNYYKRNYKDNNSNNNSDFSLSNPNSSNSHGKIINNNSSSNNSISIHNSNRSKNVNIFSFSEEEISIKILKEINQARKDPIAFSKKVEKYSKFIEEDKSVNKKYLKLKTENETQKVYLKKDEFSFFETIDLLKNLAEKKEKEKFIIDELIPLNDLKFPLTNDLDKLSDFNYIDFCIEQINLKIFGKYELKAFHYNISFIEIEPLAVIHVVDDCNFDKLIQNAIFNPNVKYIGINFKIVSEGVYIVYFVYSC